jgi:hypothetical protein
MRRSLCGAAVLAALVCGAGLARANDSSSELAAGGLVLTKTDAVAMQREDLSLAPQEVRVRYEFRNDTGKPVTLRVAFPMPEVPRDTPDGMETTGGAHNIDMEPPTGPNFLDFHVLANGKDVTPDVEIRARLPDGRDVTDDVRALGGDALLLRPRVYGLGEHDGKWDLDEATRARLAALGDLQQDPDAYETLWTTRVTFHWMQTFAPGVTVIEHRYRPVLGVQLLGSVAPGNEGRIDAEHGRWTASGSENPTREFCIDPATDKALRPVYRRAIKGREDGYVTAYTLGYVLKTGANWAGPIGTFHLTLQGGQVSLPSAPGGEVAVMSLCTDLPLRATGKMRFEATVKDYVPKEDLRVLLVTGPEK